VETETIARHNPGIRDKIIPRNRITIGRRLKHGKSGSHRKTTQSPSRRNARRHRSIIQRRATTTGPSLPEDGSNNHCNHHATTRVISKCRGSRRPPINGSTMRPSSARNTTSRHPRQRRRNPTSRTRIKLVPATVRGTDLYFAGCVKRRGMQVAPGVFAFATSPPLAKSAREHHAAAI